ncbi:MAG: hypothetical protein Ta2G_20200 [Termitinemataceae bacterium]|nr:MAG: hypothetical protein Ta2G_20200 [Termitinemataceae bacterium]
MTYQIPVFANGARGSAAFFFVFFNPIKYTDTDGKSIFSGIEKMMRGLAKGVAGTAGVAACAGAYKLSCIKI